MAFFDRREVLIICRLILGGVLLFASFDKVLHTQQFAIAVRGYQILPVAVTNVFAMTLAWSEAIAGALLILGFFARQAATAAAMLMTVFIAALTIVLVKGLAIDCGCFHSDGGGSTVGPLLIVRNVGLLALALLVSRFGPGALAIGGRGRARARHTGEPTS